MQGTALSPRSGPTTGDFPFSDAEFTAIAARARADFGMNLPPQKKELVYSRLARRLRALGLDSFAAYCALIDGPAGEGERLQMVTALTTNVSHFFREAHHFETLRRDILPGMIEKVRGGGRARIWSAGCSAGQEPYSIALTILDVWPEAARHDIRILATDVDPEILRRAREGIYAHEDAAAIPAPTRARHLNNVEAAPDKLTIGPGPRALIAFAELNLIQDWPMRGPFDVIFCRNVAIYFDREIQARLWQRLVGMLAPGGMLFIGHSERIHGEAAQALANAGVTSYRMRSTPASNTEGRI